jgi:hypothetical protein
MSDFGGMRKTTQRIGLATILVGLTAAAAAYADFNWQDSNVEGLLKTFSVHPEISEDEATVGFKNISYSPITFRFRVKCLEGPTRKQGKVAGDSPWFTDHVEVEGSQQMAWASWEGCAVDGTRADGGIQIEVKRR